MEQHSTQQEQTTRGHRLTARPKSGIFKPKFYATSIVNEEPETSDHEVKDEKWKDGMNEEYNALIRNKTWSLVPQLPHKSIIGCKWICKLKRNPDGTVKKYKARLVAKGYTQQHGFDFNETFLPVIKPTKIKVILTIALHKG